MAPSGMNLRDALADADRRRVAIGHFNISDLAALKGVVAAAAALRLPVLVGVSEGERDFVGVREIAALIRTIRAEHPYPIFLNADHTHSLSRAEEAARAGFDEIIFDGSALSFDENVRETKRAIGTSSAVRTEVPKGMGNLTTPAEAKAFVQATGIDVLAPAVGNMHGMLASMVRGDARKRLDIERIKAIKDETGALMTLHGGSGTDDEDFRRAIKAGMTIVHINTELRLAWRRSIESALAQHPDEVAPYKILPDAVKAVQEVVTGRLRLFSS